MNADHTPPAAASPDMIALGLALIEQAVNQCARNGARAHQIRAAVYKGFGSAVSAEAAS